MPQLAVPPIPDPYLADYAPTGRASCKKCQALIGKNSIRFGRKVRSPWHDGFDIQYRHFSCGLDYVTHPQQIGGIEDLQWKDFEKCVNKFKNITLDSSHPIIEEYRKRNERFWALRSVLSELPISALLPALELNTIWYMDKIKSTEAAAIIADGLLFGKLPQCPVCEHQSLRQKGSQIKCEGFLEGSTTRCLFLYQLVNLFEPDVPPNNSEMGISESDIQRTTSFILPPTLLKLPALRHWKRQDDLPGLEHTKKPRTQRKRNIQSDEDTEDSVPCGKELLGLRFSSIGPTNPEKRDLEKLILKHHGEFHQTLTTETTYLLIGDDIMTVKKTQRYMDAIRLGIPILHCSFIGALVSRDCVYPKDLTAESSNKPDKKKSRKVTPIDKNVSSTEIIKPRGLMLRQRKYAKYYLCGGQLPLEPIPSVMSILNKESIEKKEHHRVTSEIKSRPKIDAHSQLLQIDSWFDKKPLQKIYVDALNNAFNCMTLFTDITTGINKFYKQQIIVLETPETQTSYFWLFRRWGRVGDDSKLTNDFLTDKFWDNRDGAIVAFKKRCKDLTGINWDERFDMTPMTGKYRYVLLSGENESDHHDSVKENNYILEKASDLDSKILTPKQFPLKSELSDELKHLIELIFDKHIIESALQAHNIDIKKMPLGTISRRQMEEGYAILDSIQQLLFSEVETHELSPNITESTNHIPPLTVKLKAKIIAATNKFYAAIPHQFPLKATPPILDSPGKLRHKIELIEQLMEISVTNSIMNDALATSSIYHPLDSCYQQLQCNLIPLDNLSHEFNTLKMALKKNHAITHTSFEIQLVNVFACERHGELQTYENFIETHNQPYRQYLWHGSRLTNWPGILKHGLRVAPNEAPISGYMFDKGVYFADMVSKAAQYCFASSTAPYGLLVLCEVALGNPLHRLRADAHAKTACFRNGCLHTWGVGQTTPSETEFTTFLSPIDKQSVRLNTGQGVSSEKFIETLQANDSSIGSPSLLYNEYIVYNEAQILIRYVLQVCFKFKAITDESSSSSSSSSDESCSGSESE